MTDQTRTYLDPLHDELDRLRKENAELLADYNDAEGAYHRVWQRAKQAEARVDHLTDQLNLANDTLRHRATAVNATGATNDTLRAKVARVDSALRLIAPEHITPHGARIIRAALVDQEPTP